MSVPGQCANCGQHETDGNNLYCAECEEWLNWREAEDARLRDELARKQGFDRRGPGRPEGPGLPCDCEWSSAIHGDVCPEHGRVGVPIASEEDRLREQVAGLEKEREELRRLPNTIAAILGWGNTPPLRTFEMDVKALRDRERDLRSQLAAAQERIVRIDAVMKSFFETVPDEEPVRRKWSNDYGWERAIWSWAKDFRAALAAPAEIAKPACPCGATESLTPVRVIPPDRGEWRCPTCLARIRE